MAQWPTKVKHFSLKKETTPYSSLVLQVLSSFSRSLSFWGLVRISLVSIRICAFRVRDWTLERRWTCIIPYMVREDEHRMIQCTTTQIILRHRHRYRHGHGRRHSAHRLTTLSSFRQLPLLWEVCWPHLWGLCNAREALWCHFDENRWRRKNNVSLSLRHFILSLSVWYTDTPLSHTLFSL